MLANSYLCVEYICRWVKARRIRRVNLCQAPVHDYLCDWRGLIVPTYFPRQSHNAGGCRKGVAGSGLWKDCFRCSMRRQGRRIDDRDELSPFSLAFRGVSSCFSW